MRIALLLCLCLTTGCWKHIEEATGLRRPLDRPSLAAAVAPAQPHG